jgi:hypothetical protein
MSGFGCADSFSSDKSVQECFQAAHDSLLFIGCQPVAGQDGMDCI